MQHTKSGVLTSNSVTGRLASVDEIAGSGTIRFHYKNDGSVRQLACTAVDYHDADIRAKLDVRYPPQRR